MSLFRPGRKRACYKHKHSFHKIDMIPGNGAFGHLCEICSKCGLGVTIIDKFYEKRALELLRRPLVSMDERLSGKTITFTRGGL